MDDARQVLRDKLLVRGIEVLTDQELLALALGRGSRKQRSAPSSGEAAQRLLAAAGDLRGLAGLDVYELARALGCRLGRACELAAALALGQRSLTRMVARHTVIRGPRDVFEYFHPRTVHLVKEVFFVLLLDTKNRVLREERVSEGILGASLVHPREVFRSAIKLAAHALIVCHNHPSGDPTPSREDREITARLDQCGQIVGIRLLDHVVLGETDFTSLRHGSGLESEKGYGGHSHAAGSQRAACGKEQ
ncbi:MAG: DNA repair protein RadC [Planctomycetota bacterium]